MSDLHYMTWFVATAAMIVTVLTVGTLAAAGLLTRKQRDHDARLRATAAPERRSPEAPSPESRLPEARTELSDRDRRHAA